MLTLRTKADVLFEKQRKALLMGLRASAKGQGTEKVIRFRNNYVPRFLSRLDAFERRSRRTSLMVK